MTIELMSLHQRYDKSSKWMIQHHGDSILRMAGIEQIKGWTPRQAEVVQPRQLPDGLLEVELAGAETPDLFLLEIATYPEQRVIEQLTRDMMLVYLDQGVLPETVALVLCRKGQYQIPNENSMTSRLGFASCAMRWRIVRLWDLKAEDLFAMNEVGLIPWIPLTSFDGPPEPVFERCRETIERHGPPDEVENLFAVTQVLSILRYDDERLLDLIGGKRIMIESPLIRGIVDEAVDEAVVVARQDYILKVLNKRFGETPTEVVHQIRSITDPERLDDLLDQAVVCDRMDSLINPT